MARLSHVIHPVWLTRPGLQWENAYALLRIRLINNESIVIGYEEWDEQDGTACPCTILADLLSWRSYADSHPG